MASQTTPSSSSASPIRLMKRRPGPLFGSRWSRTYSSASQAQFGATAPRPTEPVEKSTPSGSLVRLG